MRSSSFVVICTLAVALFSSGALAASVFSQHSLEKRQVDNEPGKAAEKFDGIEPELSIEERIQLVRTVINQTDPKQCYPRLLCEIASSESGYDHFRYLTDIFGGAMEAEIGKLSQPLQEFSSSLKSYIDAGKELKSVEECRKKYDCEFTGVQIEEHTAYLEQQLASLLPEQEAVIELETAKTE